MNLNQKLPLIEMRIDENAESFVNAIAIVEHPAIENNFLAFSKKEELKFSFDDEKMELLGAALIPDKEIFRANEAGNYVCFFTKETIRKTAQIFFKKGFGNNLNIEHSEKNAESFVFQSYIVDKENGINPKGLDVTNGTWIVGVKVNDKNIWKDIKDGRQKGFSVEGLFTMIDTKRYVEMSTDNVTDEDIQLAINTYLSALNKIKY